MNIALASVWNLGTCSLMLREPFKWKTHEDVSINAENRGGPKRISVEASVMEVERRSSGHSVLKLGQP